MKSRQLGHLGIGADKQASKRVRRDLPRLQVNQRPMSILHQSGNWGSVAPATDAGVSRYSHKTYEAREAGSYLWHVPLLERSRPVSALLQRCRDARFCMECLRQFGLTGIRLRMSEPGQQRIMVRSDYRWASSFRHGSMLHRKEARSLLYFVYTLLTMHPYPITHFGVKTQGRSRMR